MFAINTRAIKREKSNIQTDDIVMIVDLSAP